MPLAVAETIAKGIFIPTPKNKMIVVPGSDAWYNAGRDTSRILGNEYQEVKMLLQKKVNRALEKLHEDSVSSQQDGDFQEDDFRLEKNDFLAMVISAFLVFIPAALLVLGGIVLIGYLFLMH